METKKQLLLDALEVTDIIVLDKTGESLDDIADILVDDAKENEEEGKSIDKVSDDNTIEDKADDDTNAGKNIINSVNVDNIGNADKIASEVIDTATNVDVSDKDANVDDTLDSDDLKIPLSERNSQDSLSSIPISQESSFQVVDAQEPLLDSQVTTNLSEEISTQESSLSSQLLNSQESLVNLSQLTSSSTNSDSRILRTPDSKTGLVKETEYGTPVLNIASSYAKLPSDDKFAKDICDIINFENLPNSTGKYKKISALLKKVKTEVDRIQDS